MANKESIADLISLFRTSICNPFWSYNCSAMSDNNYDYGNIEYSVTFLDSNLAGILYFSTPDLARIRSQVPSKFIM